MIVDSTNLTVPTPNTSTLLQDRRRLVRNRWALWLHRGGVLFFSPEATSITAGLFRRICDGFVAMTEGQAAKGMRGLSAVVLSRLFQPKVRDYETHGEREITWILLVEKQSSEPQAFDFIQPPSLTHPSFLLASLLLFTVARRPPCFLEYGGHGLFDAGGLREAPCGPCRQGEPRFARFLASSIGYVGRRHGPSKRAVRSVRSASWPTSKRRIGS